MDIKTLCLGVLTFGDMTGYDIKKYFEEAFNHFFVAGFGSIYPALSELMEKDLVTCTQVTQDKGPHKKVYTITEPGRALLREELIKTAPRHKVRSEFLVLIYFAHLLPVERLVAVLNERSTDIQNLLELLHNLEQQDCDYPGHRFAIGLGRVTLQAQLDYIQTHRNELLTPRAATKSKDLTAL